MSWNVVLWYSFIDENVGDKLNLKIPSELQHIENVILQYFSSCNRRKWLEFLPVKECFGHCSDRHIKYQGCRWVKIILVHRYKKFALSILQVCEGSF